MDMSVLVVNSRHCDSFKLNGSPTSCSSRERHFISSGKKKNQIMQVKNTGVGTSDTDNFIIPPTRASYPPKLPPLVGALKASAEESTCSFHFPGHNRGQASPPSLSHLIGTRPFLHDLPELPELDNLFAPEGPIFEAQMEAAKLFGAAETWFLVGGSTCGVQAAVMATCSPGDTLILPRNSHISAISAMVISGAIPKYIVPEYDSVWDIAAGITSSQVAKAIRELEMEGRKAATVLALSPTYHGLCSDLGEIAKLCHSLHIPLIVDEAHGAHLGFHPSLPRSALSQGADLSIQSTHKVLCSLTQSSMLHMQGSHVERERISRCLQALQSSSPSYLLLASLDAARAQISENRENIFNRAVDLAFEARGTINNIPGISVLEHGSFFSLQAIDPLRITVGVWKLGLSGSEADNILYREFGIVSELVGAVSITLAFNLGTKEDDVLKLVSGLRYLSATFYRSQQKEDRANEIKPFVDFDNTLMGLSPREAFFARKQKVSIKDSIGKICGELVCPYPPGIPVLIPGEIITEGALNYLLFIRSKGAIISGAANRLLSSLVVCDASEDHT